MKIALVIPSIREFKHWEKYKEHIEASSHQIDIIVVGEQGNVSGIKDCWYIGREEVSASDCPESLRGIDYAYAEIYKKNYDAVVMVDDDTYPHSKMINENFFDFHMMFLKRDIISDNYENLLFNAFPRGLPYCERTEAKIILHQGLWTGHGDFFAVDKFNLKGWIPSTYGIATKGKGLTISSMNISFLPEIIPAFYQIPVRRFDDIWSGLILKRIADHLGYYISWGLPFVFHDQAPRPIEKDIITEVTQFSENEKLWKRLKNIKLTGKTYSDCYLEIADGLNWKYSELMRQWVNYFD